MTTPTGLAAAGAATAGTATTLAEHAAALQSVLGDMSTMTIAELVAFFKQNQRRDDFPSVLRAALPQIVLPHAQAAAMVTAQWYDELGHTDDFRATQVVDLPAERFDKTAGWALYAPTRELVPDDFVPRESLSVAEPQAPEVVLSRLAGSTKRMVYDAGRQTVVANAAEQGVKWARYAQPDACAFCRLLATRTGSRELYSSAESAQFVVGRGKTMSAADRRARAAGQTGVARRVDTGKRGQFASGGTQVRGSRALGELYHDHCRCVPVAVPVGQTYHPPDYTAEWEQQYVDARKAVRKNGDEMSTKNILTEMRKADGGDRKGRTVAEPTVPVKLPAPEPVNLDEPRRPAVDPLPRVRVKPDLTPDPVADLKATNPNFAVGREWQVNCTRAATTVELRARGYDVTAQPKPENVTDNGYKSILDRWTSPDGSLAGQGSGDNAVRDAAPGETLGMSDGSRVWHRLPAGRRAARAAADDAVAQWGDGARGFITVTWAGTRRRSAHIFNVENRGGTVVYTDGQSNQTDASAHWDRFSPAADSARIVRTDDLTPTRRVMEWARERTDADINTPSEADIRAEATKRGFSSVSVDARAFGDGARAVFSGEEPNPRYSGFTATQSSYDQGAAWARSQVPHPEPQRGTISRGNAPVAGDDPVEGGEGRVDRSKVPGGLHQHELDTAHRLAARGHHVEFVPRSDTEGVKSPDILLDGVLTEMKTLTTNSANTLQGHLRTAQSQSRRVVLDLTNSPMSDDRVKSLVEQYGRRYHLVDVQVIRDAGGVDWRWTPDAGQ